MAGGDVTPATPAGNSDLPPTLAAISAAATVLKAAMNSVTSGPGQRQEAFSAYANACHRHALAAARAATTTEREAILAVIETQAVQHADVWQHQEAELLREVADLIRARTPKETTP